MANKNSVAIYDFWHLRNVSGGYAGYNFESISTVYHQHLDFYELILITSGSFEHFIENITTTVPAGTLMLFKPGVTHQLYTEPFKSTHFVLCIDEHFFEKYVSRAFPDFDIENMNQYISKPISKEKARYMEYLGKSLCKNSSATQSAANELLFLSISDFMEYNNTFDCSTYVSEIIHKINNQVYMNVSVNDICANYPYSQSMLLRQFKTLTGMTIVEYKTQQKLKYACELLLETKFKVIEIASVLQYDSVSYFLHAFKKQYGITPSEYRKQNKKH